MSPRRQRRTPAPRRGFSLLEVIVVLAILGTIAGVSAPAFINATREDELASSVEEIVTLLDRTRRTAAQHGSRASVVIEPASLRYWVTVRNAEGDRTVSSGRLTLAPGAELISREPRPSFTFDPTGRASTSDISVRRNETTSPIVVDVWTGATRAGTR